VHQLPNNSRSAVVVRGAVERGDQRGRTLGFPTANLSIDGTALEDGVWAGWLDRGAGLHLSAISVGGRPTFYGRAGQRLLEAHVLVSGNPAASFFYLLTAMHGLHVMGGLIAWSVTAHGAWPADRAEPALPRAAHAIGLCARYWHFLLAVWVVLLATLAGATPALVAWVCGPIGALR